MLKNSSQKILLLSHRPEDVSFLAEVATAQQAVLEMALNESDLCSKMVAAKNENTLVAAFVDVSTAESLRKFEFAFQSKLGNSLASELTPFVHFLSKTPLIMNREVLSSPYFSSYSEFNQQDFQTASVFYGFSYSVKGRIPEGQSYSFDQTTIENCFELMKKQLLEKQISIEWMMRFKKTWMDVIEDLIPSRFEYSSAFNNGSLLFSFATRYDLSRDQLRAEKILETGASIIWSSHQLVIIVPVFNDLKQAKDQFKFIKLEGKK